MFINKNAKTFLLCLLLFGRYRKSTKRFNEKLVQTYDDELMKSIITFGNNVFTADRFPKRISEKNSSIRVSFVNFSLISSFFFPLTYYSVIEYLTIYKLKQLRIRIKVYIIFNKYI